MVVVISPTERALLEVFGDGAVSNNLPETYGADILFYSKVGLVAIQRKKFPDDFLASLRDGRLMREVALLTKVQNPVLLIEGIPHYDGDGNLVNTFNHYNKKQIRNLLRSIELMHGINIEFTENLRDTADAVTELQLWYAKEEHGSLLNRTKQLKNSWGQFTEKDTARFLLQGFPGIGVKLADKIYDHFKRIPIKWDCNQQELAQLGIGEKKVKVLFGLLRQK